MKKVIFFANVAVPFRIEFYNQLGKNIDLTVVFEAEYSDTVHYNWNLKAINNFKCVFLNKGEINEKKISFNILKHLKQFSYDFIIVSGYASLTDKLLISYLKFKKIPFYMQIDGGLIRKENFIKKVLKKFLISGAQGYFSPSETSDNFLINYGAQTNKITRYPFTSLKEEDILKNVITDDEKMNIKKKLGITKKNIVLSIGQFIPRKGMDILIKASKNLNLDVDVYIVGGEATYEYNNLLYDLKINNIKFIGYKSKEQLKEYFLAADIFVLATREDIWGLVINEAMSHGLPIITTDKCLAGIELVHENKNGYIISTEDVIALHNKMKYLIDNDSIAKEMKSKSLEIIKDYTIEKMVVKYLDVLC